MSTSKTITRTDLTNILNELGTGVPYEDTGYQTLANGIKYRRKNGVVYVDCYISSGTTLTTSYQVLGTLPEGYKPSLTLYEPVGYGSASVGVAYVNTAGNVGAKIFSGTTTSAWFHFAYPVATNALFDEKVDYIVEQGTSGIWTYRKWNSGVAECWGKTSVASNTYAANGGYKNIVQTLPSGLFNAIPNSVIASGRITTLVQTAMGFTSADSANQVQTYLINRGTSAITQAGEVYWTVKGTWK